MVYLVHEPALPTRAGFEAEYPFRVAVLRSRRTAVSLRRRGFGADAALGPRQSHLELCLAKPDQGPVAPLSRPGRRSHRLRLFRQAAGLSRIAWHSMWRISNGSSPASTCGTSRFSPTIGAVRSGWARRPRCRSGFRDSCCSTRRPFVRHESRCGLPSAAIPVLGALAVRGSESAFRWRHSAWPWRKPERITPAVRAGYLAPYRTWHDRIAVLRFIQDIPLSTSHPSYHDPRRDRGIAAPVPKSPHAFRLGRARLVLHHRLSRANSSSGFPRPKRCGCLTPAITSLRTHTSGSSCGSSSFSQSAAFEIPRRSSGRPLAQDAFILDRRANPWQWPKFVSANYHDLK